eukprot:2256506-Amphidinium_carterae.1
MAVHGTGMHKSSGNNGLDCTGRQLLAPTRLNPKGEFVIKYASYHPSNAWDGDQDLRKQSQEEEEEEEQ